MLYQCGSCQYFNPGASMCFSYFDHQTFRFTGRNGIVSWSWGSWDSKGKETFFARGWEKNCPSAKNKGHWTHWRSRTWHIMAQILQIGLWHTMAIWKREDRQQKLSGASGASSICGLLWIVVLQIYPKHPKTSQNIHVACVCSKSLVQIDTAGRQTCSPWQRFRFRPCSQVHPVSPSARPGGQTNKSSPKKTKNNYNSYI